MDPSPDRPAGDPPAYEPPPAPPGADTGARAGEAAYAAAPPRFPIDLVQELRTGRRARAFLWLGLAGAVVNAATGVVAMDWMARELPSMLDAIEREQVYEPVMGGAVLVASTVGQLSSLAVVAAGLVFVVWFHRAMTSARDLGLPQRLSPTWGVLGFILPVIDFWFPYWGAADLFPPGHPGRRLVGRWWMAWIGARLTTIASAVLAFVSVVAAGAGAVATVFCYVVAAVLGRAVIAAALTEHHALAERTGRVPPGFDVVAAMAAATAGAAGAGGAGTPDPWARAAEAADREAARRPR
jgi:hypothetical protein